MAYRSPGLRPIRGCLRSMTLLVLGYAILLQVESTGQWRAWISDAPAWRFVFADAILELIPCLLLASSLVGSGLTRRDVMKATGGNADPQAVNALLKTDLIVSTG